MLIKKSNSLSRRHLGAALTLVVAGSLGNPAIARESSGKPLPIHTRIVGGTDVSDGAYPFMASLQAEGDHFCGGALITPTRVLTAAHCVQYETPSTFDVVVGRTVLTNPTQGVRVSVAKIHVHPAHRYRSNYDVAVLDLAAPVPGITPAALVTGSGWDVEGNTYTNIGWGYTGVRSVSEYPEFPDRLKEVLLPVANFASCSAAYKGIAQPLIAGIDVCAGLAGKDACQGDSGGPMFAKFTDGSIGLVATVSRGLGCARKDYPGIFTLLTDPNIADFIADPEGFAARSNEHGVRHGSDREQVPIKPLVAAGKAVAERADH